MDSFNMHCSAFSAKFDGNFWQFLNLQQKNLMAYFFCWPICYKQLTASDLISGDIRKAECILFSDFQVLKTC